MITFRGVSIPGCACRKRFCAFESSSILSRYPAPHPHPHRESPRAGVLSRPSRPLLALISSFSSFSPSPNPLLPSAQRSLDPAAYLPLTCGDPSRYWLACSSLPGPTLAPLGDDGCRCYLLAGLSPTRRGRDAFIFKPATNRVISGTHRGSFLYCGDSRPISPDVLRHPALRRHITRRPPSLIRPLTLPYSDSIRPSSILSSNHPSLSCQVTLRATA